MAASYKLWEIYGRKAKEAWTKYHRHVLLVSWVKINQSIGLSPFKLICGVKPELVEENKYLTLEIPKELLSEEKRAELKIVRLKTKEKALSCQKEQTYTFQRGTTAHRVMGMEIDSK